MNDIKGLFIALVLGGGTAIAVSSDWSELIGKAKEVVSPLLEDENAWKKSPVLVLERVTNMAAHPLDPSLPSGITGVSDEEIDALSVERRQQLLTLGVDALSSPDKKPYHAVALARLAFSLGDDDKGNQLLANAANGGSAIAHAFLGDAAKDRDSAISHYQAAVEGGFEEAREPLEFYLAQIRQEEEERETARIQAEALSKAQAEATRQRILKSFARPDLIEALGEGRAATFRNLRELTYLANLVNQLEDPNAQYKAPGIQLVINRRAGKVLGYKVATNSNVIQQSAQAGMQNLWGMLKGMAETRQRGGSVYEEVAAMTKGATTVVLGGEVADGEQDGMILLALFNEDPDAFKAIYNGIMTVIDNI